MSDNAPTQVTPTQEWFVVDEKGTRQHAGMITETQADGMLKQLLTESVGKGQSFAKKKYLQG